MDLWSFYAQRHNTVISRIRRGGTPIDLGFKIHGLYSYSGHPSYWFWNFGILTILFRNWFRYRCRTGTGTGSDIRHRYRICGIKTGYPAPDTVIRYRISGPMPVLPVRNPSPLLFGTFAFPPAIRDTPFYWFGGLEGYPPSYFDHPLIWEITVCGKS